MQNYTKNFILGSLVLSSSLLLLLSPVRVYAQNTKPMNNPLVETWNTPHQTAPFDKIKPEHFKPALLYALEEGKKEVEAIANNPQAPTFENTLVALDNVGSLAGKIAGILNNLTSAETSEQLQKISEEVSPLLADYGNDIILNEKLFQRIKKVYESKANLPLNEESQMLLEKTYKNFTRNGANLTATQKELIRSIDKRLSVLTLTYADHVLNDINGFTMELAEESEQLAGLPDFVREAAKQTAKKKNKKGYVFTLQAPSYVPFMTYSSNRELRKKMLVASGKKGFNGDANDNSQLCGEIVQLRHQRARVLGYKTHADFVLEERMAENPETVNKFLDDLYNYAKPVAEKQIAELLAYAKTQGFTDNRLQRWDYSYYAEKLKKEKYDINAEVLKPYFKLENVIAGAFFTANKLFGLTFKENKNIPVFHSEVNTYEVYDSKGNFLAVLYTDFFPREGKRNGAWMTSYQDQKKLAGKDIRPHVSLTCNFTRPTDTKPSLLTFDEASTLFHELGHCLHGMLSQGTYQSLSGTNVSWDFVEMPSQIFENWCFEPEVLAVFAKHYQTGEVIPQALVEKIKASSNFMEGYGTMRQLSLAMLDMAWHGTFLDTTPNMVAFEKSATGKTDLFPTVEGIATSPSFSHVFSGGYSSGYYSYKWAEILDADAYELFKEKGIFNKEVAERLKDLLSKGGSEKPMVLYKRFRGQEPSPKALLKRSGLIAQ